MAVVAVIREPFSKEKACKSTDIWIICQNRRIEEMFQFRMRVKVLCNLLQILLFALLSISPVSSSAALSKVHLSQKSEYKIPDQELNNACLQLKEKNVKECEEFIRDIKRHQSTEGVAKDPDRGRGTQINKEE